MHLRPCPLASPKSLWRPLCPTAQQTESPGSSLHCNFSRRRTQQPEEQRQPLSSQGCTREEVRPLSCARSWSSGNRPLGFKWRKWEEVRETVTGVGARGLHVPHGERSLAHTEAAAIYKSTSNKGSQQTTTGFSDLLLFHHYKLRHPKGRYHVSFRRL